jgi:hypothetical protein
MSISYVNSAMKILKVLNRWEAISAANIQKAVNNIKSK